MIVVCNSSPLVALGRLQVLDIFEHLFEKIYIPDTVCKETVLDTKVEVQREAISRAVNKGFIEIIKPKTNHSFKRNLDKGEKGVLNLAFDVKANLLVIDERKARNEAKELGFEVRYTSVILKGAEKRKLIHSYFDIMKELEKLRIYLPE